MGVRIIRFSIAVLVLCALPRVSAAQTCVKIDEANDSLAPDERAAAVRLVKKQFELAGSREANLPCETTYTLSHVRLGNTIVVSLSGPLGSREGKALGLDDLPAVYSQMVRSLTTGQPMGSLSVLDRTNVSAAQDVPPRRLQSEVLWYARIGHSSVFGPATHQGASFGVGYRAEFDRIGLDVSFFNVHTSGSGSYSSSGGAAMSLIKLEGLYFVNASANRSAYFGGGLSYGHTDLRAATGEGYPSSGRGAGLQAELSAGYEIARVTSARVFAQADVTLPMYYVEFETYSLARSPTGQYLPPAVTVRRDYAPSLTLSVGLGWQRSRR
ncbi:MAG TPA: hypothetical protein VH679_10225 [Vicinamibacterales bacterium]